jgi:AraC family transcriptional regulator of adaptative response/methylated-DNA-[protein]-cysteine methyltransferase
VIVMVTPTPTPVSGAPGPQFDEERAWRALLAREASANFVYGVVTTNVFCRPGCPSRTPRRGNVRFFTSPEQALAAGFRPCKRCGDARAADSREVVQRACRYLEEHLDERVSLRRLGDAVRMSPSHLQRIFKRQTGVSPNEYAGALRVRRLKVELRGGEAVARAGYDAGFGSASAAHAQAARHLGMTPAEYRAGARGVRVAYVTGPCRYGRLLVAATARGVCAVSIGDTDAALEADVLAEYPDATVGRGGGELEALLERVVRIADGVSDADAIPLDVAASAFQWRVWRALQAIVPGQTRTYGEIAQEVGVPGAARAVGRACASNRLALVIPCHRVVRADGEPGDYRWGAERKRALLADERAALSCR